MYKENEETFYLYYRSCDKNGKMLYESTDPVSAKLVGECVQIRYIKAWDDMYDINASSGRMTWKCKGYDDKSFNPESYDKGYIDSLLR